MSDWQVGDLALCIKQGPWQIVNRGSLHATMRPLPGRVYTVRKVERDTEIWLGFIETGIGIYRHTRFVKVTPSAEDEFDREVIELMNRIPTLANQAERTRLLDGG